MKISKTWLNEYVPVADIPASEFAERLSRTGIEVDGVENIGAGLKKIVVGHVLSMEKHPDADKLNICQIDVGEEEPYQIVCGAPNIAPNQKVIVAMPGSRIKDNVKIKKSKLRGVKSNGMVCSLEELGFSEAVISKAYADGIYVLPADAQPGDSVIDYLNLDDDIVELDITPNRADALSMMGTAYEVGAVYNKDVTVSHIDTSDYEQASLGDDLKLSVTDTDKVPAYYAYLVKNVTVKPSPLWLQVRLMKAGIRPMNNIVDITNYVLMEYGQPLHAFDYDKLPSHTIETRMANNGEELVTLDEETRELSEEDIVITDGERPIALAGVMGGLDTEITDNTTNVLIEAATFNPVNIRKTARKFGLRSESSLRNERGINIDTIAETGARAAELMHKLADGEVVLGRESVEALDFTPQTVTSSLSFINHRLGTDLDYDTLTQIFNQLGFSLTGSAEHFTVTIPNRRWDISIPADLVEEVARIYGYDKLPATLPESKSVNAGLTPWQAYKRQTNQLMRTLGFDQAIAYSLTSEKKQPIMQIHESHPVALDFPMSDDRRLLRTNLTTALLDVVQYNTARQTKNVQVYEIGQVFSWEDDNELPSANTHLAAVWTGMKSEKTWNTAKEAISFFDMKGVVETILTKANREAEITYEAVSDYADMHPGQTAKVLATTNDETIELGYMGKLHPDTAKNYDLKNTFVFEMSLEAIFNLPEKQVVQMPLPKHPGSSRDIALLVSDEVTHETITQVIRSASDGPLVAIELFDIYRGENIESGKKSMAYSLAYLNPETTLTDEEISSDVDKITTALQTELNAEIR
ncbi:phenylalanine--tRNA ligase subunit beta [Aerococcus suis]|uniref:Phenylalanine--tRNA ligase beta subunit n=1 Tax=Aerococcus suis TaxID=371602 RepID=A0A1W1Y228_9LACT|nr:phenylalanine--tRNA ligase subunit beta [Aerococcus suis]SMC30197.1 phenylalanyl-tRNA synthetase beta subunit [Aerococcus suis]